MKSQLSPILCLSFRISQVTALGTNCFVHVGQSYKRQYFHLQSRDHSLRHTQGLVQPHSSYGCQNKDNQSWARCSAVSALGLLWQGSGEGFVCPLAGDASKSCLSG